MHIKIRLGDTILFLLFFLSLLLAFWGLGVYRMTVIPNKILFAIISIGAVLGSVVTPSLVRTSYSKAWSRLIGAAIGGGMFYFLFLYANQRLSSQGVYESRFVIIETGSLPRSGFNRCFQPYVVVEFNGQLKQFVFYCQDTDEVSRSKMLDLTFSEGFFGFEVIRKRTLVE